MFSISPKPSGSRVNVADRLDGRVQFHHDAFTAITIRKINNEMTAVATTA